MTMLETRTLGRAKNVVLRFLEERLVVPKIYLDADWAGERVDVLAIDRDGGGDVHMVLLLLVDLPLNPSGAPALSDVCTDLLLQRFDAVPAQYKYLAAVDDRRQRDAVTELAEPLSDRFFSPDGIGRVGLLQVSVPPLDEAGTRLLIKPERFRAKVAKLAEEYLQQHEADWEIRA